MTITNETSERPSWAGIKLDPFTLSHYLGFLKKKIIIILTDKSISLIYFLSPPLVCKLHERRTLPLPSLFNFNPQHVGTGSGSINVC